MKKQLQSNGKEIMSNCLLDGKVFCINCQHYTVKPYAFDSCALHTKIDFVYGTTYIAKTCKQCREDSDDCGEAGNNYERRRI